MFYNKTEDAPEREVLRLTDAFANPAKSSIEVTATVFNINYGRNLDLMEKCRTLAEYSTFIDRVRQYKEEDGRYQNRSQ